MNSVDLFAGAGGWSHGWREATGHEPLVAVNHDPHAVHLHKLNHPGTEHFLEDIWQVDPTAAVAGRRIDWLHLSPSCVHFSAARGGKPNEEQSRSQAWVGIEWAKVARPRFLSLENVVEWKSWGPLGDDERPISHRKGEFFGQFVRQLEALGYVVDWRVLCAADFGAPTTRRRLFLVARRDGRPIRWPDHTHGKGTPHPWRGADECIDWGITVPSIFARSKPLATKTCARIAAGIVRHVIAKQDDAYMAPASMAGEYGTEFCTAWIAKHFGGVIGTDIREPLGTITARDHQSLVTATIHGRRQRECAAFLTSYYGAGGTSSDLRSPLPTIVTKDRHGLVLCRYAGESYAIADIGMRMLTPRELARAQGFPDSYILEGTKEQQVARIGNSVVPQVAAALVRANLASGTAVA